MDLSVLDAVPMKRVFLVLVVATFVSAPASASRRLIASDAKGAGIKTSGKVVISNDQTSIRAEQVEGKFKKTLVKLAATRRQATRPLGSPSNVPAHLVPILEDAARQHGIDPRLLAAVARRESRFSAVAVSPVGALGVMQLMPATARSLGVSDAFDPRQNIFGGARYLKMLLDSFRGDLDLTLAAYNAGPGAVRKYRGIPPYRETQAYVAAIRRDYEASLR